MGSATLFIVFNAAGTSTGVGRSVDGTLPAGAVACTDAEAASWALATLSDGSITIGAAPAPTLAQQAAAAIGAGVTLSFAGGLALAPTLFATDAATQAKLASVVTSVDTSGYFPGGAATFPLKDASGAWHSLTPAQYKAVAVAISGYVSSLDLIVDGNPLGATALPSSNIIVTLP